MSLCRKALLNRGLLMMAKKDGSLRRICLLSSFVEMLWLPLIWMRLMKGLETTSLFAASAGPGRLAASTSATTAATAGQAPHRRLTPDPERVYPVRGPAPAAGTPMRVTMPLPIPVYVRRFLGCALLAAVVVAMVACDAREEPEQAPQFTDDELYLIDVYASIRDAESLYPTQPAVAESLLTGLEFGVDSLRVVAAIDALNREPERWAIVLTEIEQRIRDSRRAR